MVNFLSNSKHVLAAVDSRRQRSPDCLRRWQRRRDVNRSCRHGHQRAGVQHEHFELDRDSTTASLTLSGSPLTSIAAGRSYSFTPTASPAASVSFSIANKPAWATFSTVTGALTGTPATGDVGVSKGIVITANNGTTSASLAGFDLTVTAPTANTGAAAPLLVAADAEHRWLVGQQSGRIQHLLRHQCRQAHH